ncbi:MAG: hypothetical protein AAF518_03440 [Spirochaetota bacterium]
MKHSKEYKFLLATFFFFATLAICIQIYLLLQTKKESIFEGELQFHLGTAEQFQTSQQFTSKEEMQNIEFELESSLINSWALFTISLVNDGNGESRTIQRKFDHRGFVQNRILKRLRTNSSAHFSSVPAGTYHIDVQVKSPLLQAMKNKNPKFTRNLIRLKIKAISGTPIWSNFFLALFLISLYPIWYIYRYEQRQENHWKTKKYERKR